jgi:hypothetical protein
VKKLIAVVLLTVLYGCGSSSPYGIKSFEMDELISTPVGGSMFTVERGYENVSGLRKGYKQELLYSGISGSTIKITYREYNSETFADYIRPSYSQQVEYDLSNGNTITFQDYLLDVIKANSNEITFRIIKWDGLESFKRIEGEPQKKYYYLD